MIAFHCPKCNMRTQCDDSQAGTKIRCPFCNQKLRVPTPPPTEDQTMLGQMLPDDRTLLGKFSPPHTQTGNQPPKPLQWVTTPYPEPIGCFCPHCRAAVKGHPDSFESLANCPNCGRAVEVWCMTQPAAAPAPVQQPAHPNALQNHRRHGLAPANVTFTCPHCQQMLEMPQSYAGRQVECFRCHGVLAVPTSGLPTNASQEQNFQRAILAVLHEDKRLADLTKNTARPKAKHSEVAWKIGQYCDLGEQLDLASCPADFRVAFRHHLRAWREVQHAVAQMPDDLLSEVVMGFINGLLRQEMDGGKGRLQANVQHAMSRVYSTWEEVEKIGAKYGGCLVKHRSSKLKKKPGRPRRAARSSFSSGQPATRRFRAKRSCPKTGVAYPLSNCRRTPRDPLFWYADRRKSENVGCEPGSQPQRAQLRYCPGSQSCSW